ncbi:AMP-binding protein [Nonomuraea salmonea]|uniref:AMP-binding protein n=1 Tax=Nonomuraea salmonea TaxID=46181 RepID=UPI002FEBB0A5
MAAQRDTPSDLSTLRALVVSGSPIPAARLREAQEVLGPVVFHGYGQTETGSISLATPYDPPPSLGVPPDAIDIEIRNPSGETGELYVRTPPPRPSATGAPRRRRRRCSWTAGSALATSATSTPTAACTWWAVRGTW